MSKLIEHSAYLEQDANDANSVFVVLKVGVKKVAVEANAIEIAAKAKGWQQYIYEEPIDPEEELIELPNPITAPEFLRLWLVSEAVKSIEAGLRQQLMASAIEEVNTELQTTLGSIL